MRTIDRSEKIDQRLRIPLMSNAELDAYLARRPVPPSLVHDMDPLDFATGQGRR